MFSPDQIALLEAKLDKANVRTRSQAGRSLSYIEAWQAIADSNAVFGFDGWDWETVEMRMVAEAPRTLGKPPNTYDGFGVSYVTKVRVTVRAGETTILREGVGAGHGIDRDLGQAHESAVKEAESDAFKRAVKSFGWRFGLALYDKEQEHVTDTRNGHSNGNGNGHDERVVNPAPRQRITPKQLEELQQRIDATGSDIALFCDYMRVEALADLTPTGFVAAMAALDAKADAKAKGTGGAK